MHTVLCISIASASAHSSRSSGGLVTEVLMHQHYSAVKKPKHRMYLHAPAFNSVLLCCACRRSKYRLDCVVRTTLSGDDPSYQCVQEMEDAQGHRGVKLSKELMKIAGEFCSWTCCSATPRWCRRLDAWQGTAMVSWGAEVDYCIYRVQGGHVLLLFMNLLLLHFFQPSFQARLSRRTSQHWVPRCCPCLRSWCLRPT